MVTKHDTALAPAIVRSGEIVHETGHGNVGGAVEVRVVEVIIGALEKRRVEY